MYGVNCKDLIGCYGNDHINYWLLCKVGAYFNKCIPLLTIHIGFRNINEIPYHYERYERIRSRSNSIESYAKYRSYKREKYNSSCSRSPSRNITVHKPHNLRRYPNSYIGSPSPPIFRSRSRSLSFGGYKR